MIVFLASHPRYHTMNSWNCSTSYAHCIKVDRLGLDHETAMAALDMLDVAEAYEEFSLILREFNSEHAHRWQICQNGRSSGYLVLIQGGKGTDGRVFTWPGKALDMHADFDEWATGDLRERVNLVWEFDRTCEIAVAAFIAFAKSHTVEEQSILVPRKVKVAVPRTEGASINQ